MSLNYISFPVLLFYVCLLNEWLLFNAKWAFFSAISWRKQVTFLWHGDGDDAHWNNNPRIDMSLHADTLSWFRVNRFLLLFFNDASLAKKQQIPIVYIVSWFDPTGSRTNAIHRTRCEHVNQSIKCVFYCCFCVFLCVFFAAAAATASY